MLRRVCSAALCACGAGDSPELKDLCKAKIEKDDSWTASRIALENLLAWDGIRIEQPICSLQDSRSAGIGCNSRPGVEESIAEDVPPGCNIEGRTGAKRQHRSHPKIPSFECSTKNYSMSNVITCWTI